MARQLIEKYVFTPGAANAGTVKFPGKVDETQLLIITNDKFQDYIQKSCELNTRFKELYE